MTTLSYETIKKMDQAFLNYPTYNDSKISKLVKLSIPTITQYRRQRVITIDSEFIKMSAGRTIKIIATAEAYWTLQIEKLEILKGETEQVLETHRGTGTSTRTRLSVFPQ